MSRSPRPAWSLRGPMVIGVVALIILVVGFGGWSVSTTLAGAVVASGQIEVDRNRQAIQHPEGGVVAELLVDEGDRVAEGQVLVRLDASEAMTEHLVARARLAETGARRARLEAERDGASTLAFSEALQAIADRDPDVAEVLAGQQNLFRARADTLAREQEQLRGRITQIGAQIDALHAQEAALEAQISLAGEELIRRRSLLERGSGTVEPVVRLQRELAQLRGQLGQAVAGRAEAAERVIETELAILQLTTAHREQAIEQLREIRVSEQELVERTASLERRISLLELRAPVAGTIHGLTIFGARAVLRPADPFAYIVPEGRPLIISARVPAIDVDQVFEGQSVSLRFPAFDQRAMPEVAGQVTRVSADAFVDEVSSSSFYRTEITMTDEQARRLGGRVLIPGMPVEAYIRTEDRTPLAYLLEPFTTYFSRAMRES
ncbi:HlyD family type I secretion periplasmic adaptor subunit [Gymnodinialimonas ceratoperidinii]|uniref:Membrane fusion protein (MFP) family protein n=1 Tax=Gymnodinialimonas ceratoperidinii TaxID=2856823 RepID=A0A8F6TVN8_9RHOB|nr:HlyD family type I secretion periplasmic adaptor subunit [Gymnodinialimonas ceratoperidinii]QXT39791.1 HlyD family type I secretion periplasmic adaptor subunit [Gymnodinialimonas ceratoperidinii]